MSKPLVVSIELLTRLAYLADRANWAIGRDCDEQNICERELLLKLDYDVLAEVFKRLLAFEKAMDATTVPDVPKRPERDWSKKHYGYCDYCASWKSVIVTEERETICGDCAEEDYITTLENYCAHLQMRAKGQGIE